MYSRSRAHRPQENRSYRIQSHIFLPRFTWCWQCFTLSCAELASTRVHITVVPKSWIGEISDFPNSFYSQIINSIIYLYQVWEINVELITSLLYSASCFVFVFFPHKQEEIFSQFYWSIIHMSGRSPGEGNGNPFQYSYLGNSMDRGPWKGYSPWGQVKSDTTEWLTSIV